MKLKITYFVFAIFMSLIFLKSYSQNSKIITGVIKDTSGNPISGATISLKGKGAVGVTNDSGYFKIQLSNSNGTIVVSSMGFTDAEISANTVSPIELSLVPQVSLGNEVVVTALGIGRKSKALTYSSQTVNSDELTTVKSTNVLNSLNGKVAGVQINRSSGGAGGSVKVTIRGDKSTRNSNPLYVIDGMPIYNQNSGPDAGVYNTMPDQGDIMSTINPEDIQSMTVLKGPAATALYGSLGSNGVIVVNMKKGTSGKSRINYSNGMTFDNVNVLPKLQYSYGQTGDTLAGGGSGILYGSDGSWGNKGSYPDRVKSFFKTGITMFNSLGVSFGTDKSSTYISYSNTKNNGTLPNSSLDQNNFSIRQSGKLLNDKLIIDATFIGSVQKAKNRLNPGVYFNPLTGLYLLPRGFDLNNFKTYEEFTDTRYLSQQRWWNINSDAGEGGQDYQQNPYWVMYRDPVLLRNQNVYASISLKYLLNSWLTIQARGNVNNYITRGERDIYATTQSTLSADNGQIYIANSNATNYYTDLLLMGNKDLSANWNLNFTAGASLQKNRQSGTTIGGALANANVFMESAIDWTNTAKNTLQNTSANKDIHSLFANAELGYKQMVYLNASVRNDWSSTLAFTPTEGKGYIYPGVGLNGILSEMFHMPAFISYAKVRGNYSIVGNDINPYRTYNLTTFNAGISSSPTSTAINSLNFPSIYLRPEKNHAWELGTEWRFFSNKLGVDFTWYKSNNKNQYFQNVSVATGLGVGSNADINGGDIQNTGIELMVSYKFIDTKDFSWHSFVNYSSNRNKIVSLYDKSITADPSADILVGLTGTGLQFLHEGGRFGDFYGQAFKRNDAGQIVVDASGVPEKSDNQRTFLGNSTPKFILGWNNSFTYKNFSLSFLVDGKFGGKVLSLTQGYLDIYGASKATAEARDAGGVTIPNAAYENGTTYTGKTDAQAYYTAIGGSSPIHEAYLYSATAVRLREASLSYVIPVKNTVFSNLSVGVIGNNLFFFTRKAPFDPEQVAGNNPGGAGIDAFGFPSYRSVGFSIKCTF